MIKGRTIWKVIFFLGGEGLCGGGEKQMDKTARENVPQIKPKGGGGSLSLN